MNKKTPTKHANKKAKTFVSTARTDLKQGAAKFESAVKVGSSKVGSALKSGSTKVGTAFKEGTSTVETLLKPGSTERMAAGVAAAAGGALIAAATLGVGQTALAGAAGYAAYRGMKKEEKKVPVVAGPRKH